MPIKLNWLVNIFYFPISLSNHILPILQLSVTSSFFIFTLNLFSPSQFFFYLLRNISIQLLRCLHENENYSVEPNIIYNIHGFVLSVWKWEIHVWMASDKPMSFIQRSRLTNILIEQFNKISKMKKHENK